MIENKGFFQAFWAVQTEKILLERQYKVAPIDHKGSFEVFQVVGLDGYSLKVKENRGSIDDKCMLQVFLIGNFSFDKVGVYGPDSSFRFSESWRF